MGFEEEGWSAGVWCLIILLISRTPGAGDRLHSYHDTRVELDERQFLAVPSVVFIPALENMLLRTRIADVDPLWPA